jgi:hypothetical protein
MWRRWQREFEETRRQFDQRHEETLRKIESEHAETLRKIDEEHAEWLRTFDADQAERRKGDAERAREQKRRFDAIDAAMENDKRVTRDMILELREGRERDRDLREEMRAQREGLLRMLDEMRRDDGPSPAGA